MSLIVAIDGPAGSGKSSTARAVASALSFLYLDTGAMYRAVALAFHRRGLPFTEKAADVVLPNIHLDLPLIDGKIHVLLNGEDVSKELRGPEAGMRASRVSLLESVRRRMVEEQRRIGRASLAEGSGVVLEGRDIGTVVFPDAGLKIFMIADPAVRARRRLDEYKSLGQQTDFGSVLKEIKRRDRQDSDRQLAPLKMAEDAVVVDTSVLTFEEQVNLILNMVRERA